MAGYAGALGHCKNFSRLKGLETDGIQWDKLELSELVFEQATAILVTQGMQLSELFSPTSWFVDEAQSRVLCGGPFILLKAKLTSPADPPLRLQNVVLAGVLHYPSSMTRTDVLGKLLEQVQ